MSHPFDGSGWIARPAPAATRIVRQITHDRIDYAPVGSTLGQTFYAAGPIVAVNLDLHPPRGVDAFAADVRFTVELRTAAGDIVTRRVYEGPQLVWDYFGILLDVTPPAPAGDYVVTVRADREEIGWSTASNLDTRDDDGISPLPVKGTALLDDLADDGVRTLGVDTIPAPNPVFRRRFDLDGAAESATLSAVALGIGTIFINGSKVGDEALEPAVTDYDKSVLYRTWDVAHLLHQGRNEIRIEAGRERWAARGGDVWGWSLAPWHREPMAILNLDIDLTDGSVERIVTDGSWETASGEVETERLFRGEDRVVRADAAVWHPVAAVTAPNGQLRASTSPPVRALEALPPVITTVLDGHRTVLDFGQVMVGRLRCRVSAAAGSTIRVISGEQLSEDGSVLCDNHLVAGEAQLDTIRFERDVADLIWEPQFGYRGFRWVQIEISGDATVEDARAVPLYADVDRVGAFTTDEPVIEWIDGALARTFRNNLHGIPTDTPIYEKNGWTADAHLATEGLLHHFDLRAAFGKWIDDHIDAQNADGSMPQIIPTPGWGRATDPTWSASAVLIPWYLFREYGDREILDRAAPMIVRFADQMLQTLDGGLWPERTWGDWLSPGHMIGPEGMRPVATIMAVTVLQHTAAVLRELDDSRAERFENAAVRVAKAYHEAYFDSETGVYAVPGVPYRQVLNILPLAFGVVPEAHVSDVRDGLVRDLEQRTDLHLDCGAVGIRHLLPVLTAAGRDDLAVSVLTRRTRPSWGAWYEAGESTMLESWDRDARSRNHYFLGSVDAWVQQRVGGMRLTAPGWTSFEVAPLVDPRVRSARIAHRTPLGEASVRWQRGDGGWRFEVVVPDGATAHVRIPGAERQLGAGNHVVHLR